MYRYFIHHFINYYIHFNKKLINMNINIFLVILLILAIIIIIKIKKGCDCNNKIDFNSIFLENDVDLKTIDLNSSDESMCNNLDSDSEKKVDSEIDLSTDSYISTESEDEVNLRDINLD